jgi:hypothetical protein
MAASAAVPGLFFCFAAMVLLIFVSVSVPTFDSISFLNVGVGPAQVRYGVFGSTDSDISVGYYFRDTRNGRINSDTLHNLTFALVLHPVAAGLAGLAFFFGLCGASYHRVGTVMMSLLSGLAAIITLVVWVIDMVLFGVVRHRYRDQGVPAQFGNANWLTLGALVALMLGFCAAACGIFGRYRRKREAY